MTAYYNEIDPYAAQWLRNLIDAGHIAPGVVDERSISDIRPDDLRGFTQCHFFAGIGVWSHALRRAGWSDDAPIWTGSCPCQPFSTAGRQEGSDDERHLWPIWRNLIIKCRPVVLLGEQVSSSLVVGKCESTDVQQMWKDRTTIRLLENWNQRHHSLDLQNLSERSFTPLAPDRTWFHITESGESDCRSEESSRNKGSGFRSGSELADSETGNWGMRGDRDSIRLGCEEGLEHPFVGSDRPCERLYESQYPSCDIRSERCLRELGSEASDSSGGGSSPSIRAQIERAATVLDERIAQANGGAWIAALQTDLEGAGYAFGASDLCAAGFSGAHIRQRLYWVGVADAHRERLSGKHPLLFGEKRGRDTQNSMETSGCGETRGVADTYGWECDRITISQRCQHDGEATGRVEGYGKPESGSAGSTTNAPMLGRYAVDWLYCRDDKWRPVGPGTFPLVDETPARVGRLRAYGNALDAETATEFCIAVAESLSDIVAVDRDHVLTDTDSPFG